MISQVPARTKVLGFKISTASKKLRSELLAVTGTSMTSKEERTPQVCCLLEGGSPRQGYRAVLSYSGLISSSTQGREVPLGFFSFFFMANQYKTASELQSCIVPTDFRTLHMNCPQLQLGRGLKGGEPCPTCTRGLEAVSHADSITIAIWATRPWLEPHRRSCLQ